MQQVSLSILVAKHTPIHPQLPLVFANTNFILVFVIAVIIWLSSEIIGGRIIPSRRRHGSKIMQRKEGLNVIAAIGLDAVVSSSIVLGALSIAVLPDWVYFLGIALMLTGVVVRQWAIAVLGRYFSQVVGVQKDQTVVQTGPYRMIRHPSYTGILLILIGFAFVFQSWAAVLIVGLSFGLSYGYRMLTEERFLVKELGDKYIEYKKRTKRIIPFVI